MKTQCGFTLIEMIISIVIMGIVAGIVAIFISRPVEGYIDSVRRAELTDVADLALKRMAIDLRTAIPNSVRVDGTGRFIEFIPARDGGRYCTDFDTGCNALSFTAGGDTFSVLGPAVSVAQGDQVVVFNTGQGVDLNVYGGSNRRAITGASLGGTALTLGATAQSADTITLGGANSFTYASPSNRFQIMAALSAVTYACENVGGGATGTGTLRRYTGYGFFSPQTTDTDDLGAGRLLANNLSDCSFFYQTVNAANGLVSLNIQIRRENESVRLFQQFHVDNMP